MYTYDILTFPARTLASHYRYFICNLTSMVHFLIKSGSMDPTFLSLYGDIANERKTTKQEKDKLNKFQPNSKTTSLI